MKIIQINIRAESATYGYHIGSFNVYDTTDIEKFARIKLAKQAMAKEEEYGQYWLDVIQTVEVYSPDNVILIRFEL